LEPISRLEKAVGNENVKSDFMERHGFLKISKVPTESLKKFKALSFREFGGDYGMTVAFLIFYYEEDIKHKTLLELLSSLNKRVCSIEEAVSGGERKSGGRTMLNGSKRCVEDDKRSGEEVSGKED
jgi:hypothetical protein